MLNLTLLTTLTKSKQLTSFRPDKSSSTGTKENAMGVLNIFNVKIKKIEKNAKGWKM